MNPYLVNAPALISVSGGRTSGYMLRRILDAHGGQLPKDVFAVFANTGKERNETLDFLHQIETRWLVPIVWLEYLAIRSEAGLQHTFRQVGYDSASRAGEPFASLIEARSFLPNPVMRYCTQELKVRVMKKFMMARGIEEWDSVIGLRADEPVRVHRAKLSSDREQWNNLTPMAAAGAQLSDVMRFWDSSPFDLALRQDEGNCDLCFLKGGQKIERLIRERPDSAGWWIEQEAKVGGTFRADRPTYRNMRLHVLEQGRLFDDSYEFDVCNCTD